MSHCHHTRFSRWSHHLHDRSTVRESVSQQTPHGLMGLCDVCCAAGYFVLLFLVQRSASVFVQVWGRNLNRQCMFAHERNADSVNKAVLEQADTDEQRSHIALVEDRKF